MVLEALKEKRRCQHGDEGGASIKLTLGKRGTQLRFEDVGRCGKSLGTTHYDDRILWMNSVGKLENHGRWIRESSPKKWPKFSGFRVMNQSHQSHHKGSLPVISCLRNYSVQRSPHKPQSWPLGLMFLRSTTDSKNERSLLYADRAPYSTMANWQVFQQDHVLVDLSGWLEYTRCHILAMLLASSDIRYQGLRIAMNLENVTAARRPQGFAVDTLWRWVTYNAKLFKASHAIVDSDENKSLPLNIIEHLPLTLLPRPRARERERKRKRKGVPWYDACVAHIKCDGHSYGCYGEIGDSKQRGHRGTHNEATCHVRTLQRASSGPGSAGMSFFACLECMCRNYAPPKSGSFICKW